MNKKIFYSVLMLLTAFACEKKLFDESVVKTPLQDEVIVQEKQLSSDDIKIEYIGQNTPNLYNVRISWENTQGFVVLKKNDQIVFDSSKLGFVKEYLIKNQPGGASFQMTAEAFTKSNEPVDVRDITIEIPKDFVIQGQYVLNSDLVQSSQRMFLVNAQIYTQSFKLSLDIDQLIVSGPAIVASFPDGSRATTNVFGLNGGSISITAKEAIGNLYVLQNAQNGGNGAPSYSSNSHCWSMTGIEREIDDPPCRSRTCAGTNGTAAGQNGFVNIYVSNSTNFNLNYSEIVANGGAAGGAGLNCSGNLSNVTPISGPHGKPNKRCIILKASNIYDCAQ
jgi:hypothetical protein